MNVAVLFVVDEDAAEVVVVSNMTNAAMDAVTVVTDEAIDVVVSVVSDGHCPSRRRTTLMAGPQTAELSLIPSPTPT